MATATKRTQDTFWRSVCKSPDDDTVRLAFADWLEENGYTPRARAVAVADGAAQSEEEFDPGGTRCNNSSVSPAPTAGSG